MLGVIYKTYYKLTSLNETKTLDRFLIKRKNHRKNAQNKAEFG